MNNIKLLLYCTKTKPILRDYRGKAIYNKFVTSPSDRPFTSDDTQPILNGKIVAECDFEVEEIGGIRVFDSELGKTIFAYSGNISRGKLENRSCLNAKQLTNYLQGKNGYAIHIKNLHIFDKPKELDDYYYSRNGVFRTLGKAPQNMMYCCDENENDYILISIQSQWMCLILNRIKDVEIRRVVLKEMLG